MKILIAIFAAIALMPSHPVKERLDELCAISRFILSTMRE